MLLVIFSIKLWLVIGINLNNFMHKKQKYKSEWIHTIYKLLQAKNGLLGCRRRKKMGFRLPQAKKICFFRKIWIFKFEIIKPREPTFDRKFEIIKPRIWDLADSDTKGGGLLLLTELYSGASSMQKIPKW